MRIDVVTLFEEFFESPLKVGLLGKAIKNERAQVGFVNPRTFTEDVHRTVDDTPYGGGAGMVMKAPPMMAAIEQAKSRGDGPVIMLSPQGKPLTQAKLETWSQLEHLVLVCGRYEGFDERIREAVDDEISIGDFVLTGGEYGALTLIDGLIRLIPGTVGNRSSTEGDSFSDNLLEHPQYTRPESFREQKVPPVLTSGDHAKIAQWRHQSSLARTRLRRPDILMQRNNTAQDYELLKDLPGAAPHLSLLVKCPSLDHLNFELDHYWELVSIYGLEALYIVTEDLDDEYRSRAKELYSEWMSSRRSRTRVTPERLGSRKQWKIAKEAAAASYDLTEASLDRIHFFQNVETALDAFEIFRGPNASQISLYDPAEGEELRHLAPTTILNSQASTKHLICIGVYTDKAESFLSGVRKASNYKDLSLSLACALLMERLVGDA